MSIPKKPRTQNASSYLDPKVLSESFQIDLEKQISGSLPYEHGVIDGLLNDDLLRKARSEIFENIRFTEKETDIYKLNQTGDLLNLDGLPENEINLLGSLLKVRDALYSQEFRDVITRVTKCGPLSGSKFDLSLNNYDKGCHLLAHDDVIGTRVISFILYLVPPDYEWNPKWGGALRLYPTLRDGVPAIDPCASIPPKWNQLSFFKILPGRSFHDVEEVYVDQPRLSIQGWFHAPQEGEDGYTGDTTEAPTGDKSKSTLAQLSQAHTCNDGYEPKREFESFKQVRDSLGDEAVGFLKKYISSQTLEDVSALAEKFAETSFLQLDDFLAPEFWDKVSKEIEEIELEKQPNSAAEVTAPWAVASPPHLRRYMYLEDAPINEKTENLQALKSLFKSQEFAELLKVISGLKPQSRYTELRRFRPGQDFTMASVSGVESEILEVLLSVTTARWEDGTGGYDLVMSGGNDENDDPAIYRAASEDDDSVLLSELPKANSLNIILRDSDLLRFVKYVSKNANGSRWDVLGQYELEQEDVKE